MTLIGCSMGARLVFHCLLELAKLGLRGCVENVILLGAPLSCRWASGGACLPRVCCAEDCWLAVGSALAVAASEQQCQDAWSVPGIA